MIMGDEGRSRIMKDDDDDDDDAKAFRNILQHESEPLRQSQTV